MMLWMFVIITNNIFSTSSQLDSKNQFSVLINTYVANFINTIKFLKYKETLNCNILRQ